MRSRSLTAAAALLVASLAGCATDQLPYTGGPDNFGEANRVTMAAQVIDPNPVYDTAVPETSGDHAADALERYHTDKVKQPERQRTSQGASGGSGGSGGR